MTKLSWNKLTNNKKNFQTVWYIIARRKFDIRLFVVKTWWYLCLHFTHFIIGGYWSEDLRRSQATHQKAQCILWTCPVHSLLGRSSYQSHSPRLELWPAGVWNNKVMNWTIFSLEPEVFNIFAQISSSQMWGSWLSDLCSFPSKRRKKFKYLTLILRSFPSLWWNSPPLST